MEGQKEMLNDVKDAVSVLGVNVVGLVITMSDIEQALRICTGMAVLVYTIVKTITLLHEHKRKGS